MKELTQSGTTGPFRSWRRWAERPEHYGFAWVEDERLADLRDRLHKHATEPRTVFRIVGLNGVGKSRLTLEALRPDQRPSA